MSFSADELIQSSEKKLLDTFGEVDEIAFHNQGRLLESFRENRVTEEFFNTRTGYAIDDAGRDTLDKLFAQLADAEAACLRMQFVSGTHALACGILGNLRPGDKMVGLTGLPYDTLQPVVGITGNAPGSVTNIGASYTQIDMADALADQAALEEMIDQVRPARMYHIQKSRGYSMSRRTYGNSEIKRMIDAVRSRDPGAIVLVDNCYGEFVERDEPTAYGADLIVGSMIKNPGGGLAICGAYIAGRRECVEASLSRLTAPGVAGHIGHNYGQGRLLYQGLFMAPTVVASAVKGAHLMASVFEELGFRVSPRPGETRFDIIQSIELGSPERLINFCRALQRFSPVDAHVDPEPAHMPGYEDQIIMAGGTFVEGSTIEFSADAPLRPPYAVYAQGGLSYLHVKCSIAGALNLSLTGELPFHRP